MATKKQMVEMYTEVLAAEKDVREKQERTVRRIISESNQDVQNGFKALEDLIKETKFTKDPDEFINRLGHFYWLRAATHEMRYAAIYKIGEMIQQITQGNGEDPWGDPYPALRDDGPSSIFKEVKKILYLE